MAERVRDEVASTQGKGGVETARSLGHQVWAGGQPAGVELRQTPQRRPVVNVSEAKRHRTGLEHGPIIAAVSNRGKMSLSVDQS